MTNFVPFVLLLTGRMIAQRGLFLWIGCALLAFGGAAPTAAQDAVEQVDTPWVKDLHSALGLVAGPRRDGVVLGGIAIRLEPGWKTYWRTPGDSGVPPRFDFSASDNIAAVTVLWPAPEKFADGAGGFSFGYHNEVVLPLRIVATKPDAAVTLRARINYAVCEKLCLPVEATTELTLPAPAASGNPVLDAALRRVPQRATLDASTGFGIRAVKRDGKTVTVAVMAPSSEKVDLFAEGPTPDWALPPPTLGDTRPDGLRQFSFALEGLPSDARAEGATLKLTLAGAGRAYEYDITLD